MKIIKIGADWCPECIIMRPRWQEVEGLFPEVEMEYYDVDKNPEKRDEYKVENLPTYVFQDNDNNELTRFDGLVEVDDLKNEINKYIDR